jgi:POT family proton-dependent oligopeptide transporter
LFGYQITNLYDFFMVFVVSATVAAIILLLISGRLVKIMNAREASAAA